MSCHGQSFATRIAGRCDILQQINNSRYHHTPMLFIKRDEQSRRTSLARTSAHMLSSLSSPQKWVRRIAQPRRLHLSDSQTHSTMTDHGALYGFNQSVQQGGR